jgi:hypothetical protein
VIVDDGSEVEDVVGKEVGKFAVLEITPQIFHRIEVRSVRWQAFQGQSWKVVQDLPDRFAFVHGTAVPNYDHRTTQMLQEVAKKVRCPLGVYETAGIGPPVKAEAMSLR